MSKLPPVRANEVASNGYRTSQAPGGYSSWSFESESCEPEYRRHTNGLLKQQKGAGGPIRMPAGGLTSIDLSDVSASGSRSKPFNNAGDSLDAFVQRSHLPYATNLPEQPSGGTIDAFTGGHRNTLAPPGGRSTFSLGWGQDNYVNHHHAYSRRGEGPPKPIRPPSESSSIRGDPTSTSSAFERAFAAGMENKNNALWDRPPPSPMKKMNRPPPSYSDGFPGLGGGGGGGWMPSTRIAAPPGGASSIVFG